MTTKHDTSRTFTMSGDYINLCEVFAKHFGGIATLYFSPEYSDDSDVRTCDCRDNDHNDDCEGSEYGETTD